MDADIVTNGVSTDVLLEKFEESLGAARASRGSVGGHGVVENLYRKRGRGRERERRCLYILAQRLKWTVSKFGLEDDWVFS